ncbi:TagK domain-containing protein [Trinickia sp. YCB016]
MRIANLFKRKNTPSMRVEPTTPLSADPSPNERYHARNTIDALLANEKYDGWEKPENDDLLFGLIDTRLGADRRAHMLLADDNASDANDLIEALHEQYRRALSGLEPSLMSAEPAQRTASDNPSPLVPHEAPTSTESVETLLSRARVMEDAFGPLRQRDVEDLAELDSPPEILRLFAPAGYHATPARKRRALPPELTRRDHQAAGIDSPLSAPDAEFQHVTVPSANTPPENQQTS